MKKKILSLLLLTFVGITGFIFTNSTLNNYDKNVRGKQMISNFKVDKNNSTNAEITLNLTSSTNKILMPTVKVLTENEPVFKGERKKTDPTLGKYRIELLFNDSNVLKNVYDELKLDTKKLHKENGEIVQSVRLAYPPDDSMMVLYIGCNQEPKVNLDVVDKKLKVMISK